jgi:hypothetical protein
MILQDDCSLRQSLPAFEQPHSREHHMKHGDLFRPASVNHINIFTREELQKWIQQAR